MTPEEARAALSDCDYNLGDTRGILDDLARSMSDESDVSGRVDIELLDYDPTGAEPYVPTGKPAKEGWWLNVSGSLPIGADEEGRETWRDFEPSGVYYGKSIRDVVTDFLDDLENERR